MIKYVAFLRGINVGGRKLIKMEALRRIFESMGFANVRTYIQSGNVIFEARKKNLSTLRTKIENELKSTLGYEVSVIVLAFSDLTSLEEKDPFKRIEMSKDVLLFVTFLSSEPTSTPKLPIAVEKENFEIIAILGRAAFTVSRLKKNGHFGFPNDFIEKQFGVVGTTRKWTTVRKISSEF